MTDPQPSFHPAPSRPKLKLPPGACDAHVHVFGPHRIFPFAESRPFTPADAPKEKLFALHAMLGIEHCVIVKPARRLAVDEVKHKFQPVLRSLQLRFK